MSNASPLPDAQRRFAAAVSFRATGAEPSSMNDALGRVLAEDIKAPTDLPAYHRAIVEGFLVHTTVTQGASENNPVRFFIKGRVKPGDTTCPAINPGEAIEVATGSIVAGGPYSIVRMWEAMRDGNDFTISRPFPPRFFIEDQGCDFKQGAVVFPAGTLLQPRELGTLADLGLDAVKVARRPVVALFSCGDEVVAHTAPLKPGMIRDSNAVMLAAAIKQAGAVPRFMGIMRDDFSSFVTTARAALSACDMMVVSGGTAAGGRDFISDLVRTLGELVVDGVPMRSGRPLIMGVAGGKPIVCVAGHPPEALRGFRLFGTAALNRLLGCDAPLPEDGGA